MNDWIFIFYDVRYNSSVGHYKTFKISLEKYVNNLGGNMFHIKNPRTNLDSIIQQFKNNKIPKPDSELLNSENTEIKSIKYTPTNKLNNPIVQKFISQQKIEPSSENNNSKITVYSYIFDKNSRFIEIWNLAMKYHNVNFIVNFFIHDESNVLNELTILKSRLSITKNSTNLPQNFFMTADTFQLSNLISDMFPFVCHYMPPPILEPLIRFNYRQNDNKTNYLKIGYYFNHETSSSKCISVINRILEFTNHHVYIKIQKYYVNVFNNILKNKSSPRLHIITNKSSSDDYYNFINNLDIMILNYTIFPYVYRSSGVFFELIYSETIPIVPAHTSMAKLCEEWDIGAVFTKNNYDNLYLTIQKLLDDYDNQKSNLINFKKKYIEIINNTINNILCLNSTIKHSGLSSNIT